MTADLLAPYLRDVLHHEGPPLLKALSSERLYALAQRWLRPEFVIPRDYDILLDILAKGLITPGLSRSQLAALPMGVIEGLALQVLRYSLTIEADETKPVDHWLTAILAIEDTLQFEPEALMAEDMALLEAHPTPGMHGYYFKPHLEATAIEALLNSQGYETSWFSPQSSPVSVVESYWLSRRMACPWPWEALLAACPVETREQHYPHLARLNLWRRWLENEALLTRLPEPSDIAMLREAVNEQTSAFGKVSGVSRPVRLLILVEGNTEQILLPAMATSLGINLSAQGVLIHPVGGKNQMLQQYVQMSEQLRSPVAVILDHDALPMAEDLDFYQRDCDQMFILTEGEMEDLYAPELLAHVVNHAFSPSQPISVKMIETAVKGERVAKGLQRAWPGWGMGGFDKVALAYAVAAELRSGFPVPEKMRALMEEVLATRELRRD